MPENPAAELGRRGGLATSKKYGRRHFRTIGKIGAAAKKRTVFAIPLTQDKTALIDQCDIGFIVDKKWRANKIGNTWYAMTEEAGRTVLMHRYIMRPAKGKVVDHKNGNGLDNRRSNLRVCSIAENTRNQKPRADGTSKHRGVMWDKARKVWRARITVDYEEIFLGRFKKEADAVKAYDAAARIFYGDFATKKARARDGKATQ